MPEKAKLGLLQLRRSDLCRSHSRLRRRCFSSAPLSLLDSTLSNTLLYSLYPPGSCAGCPAMFLPLPSTALFFRSASRPPSSSSSSSRRSPPNQDRSSCDDPSHRNHNLPMRDQIVRRSSSSSCVSASSLSSQPPSPEKIENVYLVAACRRNGRCLNLIPNNLDGELSSFLSLSSSSLQSSQTSMLTSRAIPDEYTSFPSLEQSADPSTASSDRRR
ncbi:hypothetical protein BZA70DRAFT_267753 [Myxozyma melibiosi]|uniref:Uncharacterized protein n=1 Tax=Myxozyma melibiosi TaxID=54550 RepID=A0ABR1F5W3_9ASCO